MNARERFLETLSFGQPDRGFYWGDLGWWPDTLDRFYEEGLPRDVHIWDYFGFDRKERVAINWGMVPPFDKITLEETDEYEVYIDTDGVKSRRFKAPKKGSVTAMPQWLEFPVKTREDFQEMKKRFNPDSPCRYPQWWEDYMRCLRGRDYPLGIQGGSFFGWGRGLMGLENFVVAMYDDPALVHEMMEFQTDFRLAMLERAFKDIQVDYAVIWEDMAYKAGSLISPRHFREFLLPHYKRVTAFLRVHECNHILVDSDGNIEELIPLWLEGGVTCLYPMEVAAGMDVVALRKKYGRDLGIIGGIDKRELSKDKKAVEREVLSKVPWMLERGGYMPSIDHLIPSDVSFENYKYYVELVQSIAEGRPLPVAT